MVLDSESQEEFDAVLSALFVELEPVGMVEQTLVERIATTLWRQRRLARAEAAEVALKQRVPLQGKDLVQFTAALGISSADAAFTEALRSPFAEDPHSEMEAISAIVNELQPVIERRQKFSMEWFKASAPHAFAYLSRSNGGTGQGLEKTVSDLGPDVVQWLTDIVAFLKQNYRHAQTREVAHLLRETAMLRASPELIGRYQTTLDNELYRALRAFREAKNWRLSQLEGEVNHVDS
ncbi:MAG: hypothetical protein IPG34_05300 [Rhodocyclaceae bacterium]|nr:hypothetical protein [Rhodocyclaceae bacterium]